MPGAHLSTLSNRWCWNRFHPIKCAIWTWFLSIARWRSRYGGRRVLARGYCCHCMRVPGYNSAAPNNISRPVDMRPGARAHLFMSCLCFNSNENTINIYIYIYIYIYSGRHISISWLLILCHQVISMHAIHSVDYCRQMSCTPLSKELYKM